MNNERRTTNRFAPARMLAVPLLVMALTVLAACGSDSGGSDATKSGSGSSDVTTTTSKASSVTDLDGMSFVSESVTGYTLVKDTQLLFTFDGKNLAVQAGCNNMTSTYSFTDDVLKWTHQPAATMMACDQALMDQDTWITNLLTAGMEAKATSKTLTLTSGELIIELKADQP